MMLTIGEALKKGKEKCKAIWVGAFVTAFVVGIFTHLPVMLSDIPNHDGLASMYFDQNMITSGRWFLSVACGASSYFTVPWVIGLLGLFFVAVTAALLSELLELRSVVNACIVGGLLAVFPSLASTFAYVFTLDGYMLALLLAVAAVLLVGRGKWGWIPGAVCLAFSMGTYQAYLAFAVVLCLYRVFVLLLQNNTVKEKVLGCLRYLYMGITGAGLYYLLLQILLKMQGKVLDTYQGIDGLGGGFSVRGILETIPAMYKDFFSFTLRSRMVATNVFSAAALVLLAVLALIALILVIKKHVFKNAGSLILFVVLELLVLALVPLGTNVVLLISPEVNYHLIMRYQWVLLPILLVSLSDNYGEGWKGEKLATWIIPIAGAVLIFCYGLADNIGYSNLQKKYEKTYAYTLRLLDRIEQTEGYTQGMPVVMIGAISKEEYPDTDLTGSVTGSMIGLSGDYLVYTGINYASFMKNYLGATLNILSWEETPAYLDNPEYETLEAFPSANCTKVVDGILYVKTED